LSTPEAPAGVSGFDRRDWTDLLGCLAAGIGVSFGLLLLLMRTVLEPQLVDESVRRINRNVRLVEGMLIRTPVEELPEGVVVRSRLPSPDNNAYPLSAFDREVRDELRRRERLVREIRRDRAPLEDPWGGYWIQLRLPDRHSPPLWLYQPERLSSLSVWYLPILRSLALLLGTGAGIVLFLRRQVELPFRRVMAAIPDTSLAPLALLPERGVAPLRTLTLRINRLLERLNGVAADRRGLLRGLAHDLGGPQARLILQAEILQESLEGPPRQVVESMLQELRQLAAITAQLGVLADQEIPEDIHEPIALDDFCRRLVDSYPANDRLVLAVPRMFLFIDLLGLERSLCNLIDNALEYGRPPVTLSALRQGSSLRILVEDRGDGLRSPTLLTMPSSSRADDRQRQRHQGLGLLLVDRFCRSQGGRLLLRRCEGGGLRAEMLLKPTLTNPLFQNP
jgi:two-component system osmolarity sensor histidine kinase EnvZ